MRVLGLDGKGFTKHVALRNDPSLSFNFLMCKLGSNTTFRVVVSLNNNVCQEPWDRDSSLIAVSQ